MFSIDRVQLTPSLSIQGGHSKEIIGNQLVVIGPIYGCHTPRTQRLSQISLMETSGRFIKNEIKKNGLGFLDCVVVIKAKYI